MRRENSVFAVREDKDDPKSRIVAWGYAHDGPPTLSGDRKQVRRQSRHWSRKQAEEELRQSLARQNSGGVDPSKLTVEELLTRWQQEGLKRQRKPTRKVYERVCRLYLVPRIGQRKVASITFDDIEKLYGLLQTGGGRGGRGLSPATIMTVHAVLSSAFRWGRRHHLTTADPLRDAERPHIARRSHEALPAADVLRILQAVWGTLLYLPTYLLAVTGARRSEVLALTWSDVDFEAGTVWIHKTLTLTAEGLEVGPTKTGKETRVQLPRQALDILRLERLTRGANDTDPICLNQQGKRWNPDAFGHRLSRASEVAGVRVTAHMFRHFQATALIEAGVDVATVADRLGHEGPGTTMRVYVQITPAMRRRATDAVEGIFETGDREE